MSATDDEDLAVGSGEGECLIEGVGGLDIGGRPLCVGCDDNVAAFGERSLWEGEEGAAPHEHGVAGGELLEVLEIGGDVINEIAFAAYGAAAGCDGCYDCKHRG